MLVALDGHLPATIVSGVAANSDARTVPIAASSAPDTYIAASLFDVAPDVPAVQPAPNAPLARTTDTHRRARNTDPDTSLAAAKSITPDRQRAAHTLILELLAVKGPLTDFDLAYYTGTKQTSIGCRRKELVDAGQVELYDRQGRSDTNSPCIRWALTGTREQVAS